MKKLTKAERRSKRARAMAFYRIACEIDMNCRPKHVRRRQLLKNPNAPASRRWLEHHATHELAKRRLVEFLNQAATTSPD